MRIVITRWGLASYVRLSASGVVTDSIYWSMIRPDIERLRHLGSDEKFLEASFWGPARDRGNKPIADGYKMKWRNFGGRNIQMRLCVGLVAGDAFLCHAYQKTSPSQDRRESAKLKDRIQLIRENRHREEGLIS